ncbi:MAG: hypothetical protein AB7P49_07165 [Bdellovibrionales bacterium]
MFFTDVIDDPRVRILMLLAVPVLVGACMKIVLYIATNIDETFQRARWFMVAYFVLCALFGVFHFVASRPDACLHATDGVCYYLRLPAVVATHLDRVFFARQSLCVIYNACK